MNDDGATPGTYNTPITLNIVAAGNGWWVNTGPNPSEIATYIFLDAEEHPELLNLPRQSAGADWSAAAEWLADGARIRVNITGPVQTTLDVQVGGPGLEAVRHARLLYICPTTPELGLSPYLARDRSFAVRLPRLRDA